MTLNQIFYLLTYLQGAIAVRGPLVFSKYVWQSIAKRGFAIAKTISVVRKFI